MKKHLASTLSALIVLAAAWLADWATAAQWLQRLLAPAGQQATSTTTCRPVRIADGDTFTCQISSQQTIKVRLQYVDAPERGQPYARAARQALHKAMAGQTVTVHGMGQDRYGRLLAEVFSNGQSINQHMVRTGHAWAYRAYLKDPQQKRLYLQLETQARAARRGLWAQAQPVYPADYRRQQQIRGDGR